MPKQQSAGLNHDHPTSGHPITISGLPRPRALADYQSEDELAEDLDRSPRTLARWRAARIGPPYVVIGRRIFYRRAAIAQWLLKREKGSDEGEAPPRRRSGA
jgi:hypothetical protein